MDQGDEDVTKMQHEVRQFVRGFLSNYQIWKGREVSCESRAVVFKQIIWLFSICKKSWFFGHRWAVGQVSMPKHIV